MPFNFYNNQPYPMQPQVPQMQQVPQYVAPTLTGRVVNDFRDINIGDIPTDGSVAYFIKSDLSEIQTRKWSPDGNVDIGYFKPFSPQVVNVSTDTKEEQIDRTLASIEALNTRFDTIEEQISKLMPRTRIKKDEE